MEFSWSQWYFIRNTVTFHNIPWNVMEFSGLLFKNEMIQNPIYQNEIPIVIYDHRNSIYIHREQIWKQR